MSTVLILKQGVSSPSYLSSFETGFEKIHLIYAKKPSVASDNEPSSPESNKSINEESINECDLTGDPLKVDLGGDDFIQMDKMEQVGYSWTNEEAKHLPLTVREARREINKILKNPVPDLNGLPIFVVCSGDDPYNTILLGAHKKTLMSCGIHGLGFIELKDDEVETQEMINDHYKRCNKKDIEVQYRVKMKYQLYGKPLKNLPCQNASMRDLEKHASVSLDVTSNERIFKLIENTKQDINMNLELIAGHKLLRLNFVWKELNTLQSYMDILADRNLSSTDDTVLCKNPLNSDLILRNISNLVRSKFFRQPKQRDVLDLDNLRNEDFLDELWQILKYCENIGILRNSFHFLFEELADANVKGLNLEDKYSTIALIIRGILMKNVVLPAITLPQCVELLFELGAHKLKLDFQVILDHFCNMGKISIESIWKTFYQTDQVKKEESTARTTRITQYLNAANLVVKSKQLAYLGQLYVASEFIFLVKEQVYLQEDSFNSFCQHLQEKYVKKAKIFEDFSELYESPLCETSCSIDFQNIEIINSAPPSRWTMFMTSEVGSTQVTTIYDLSESPVFPPVIYNYDIPITNENMIYYITKMTQKKQIL